MNDPTNTTRLFTVKEANQLLPVIRPAIEELLATFKEIRAEIEETAAQAGVPLASGDLPKRLDERGVAPRLFEKVRSIVERIHSRGCLVNGPEAGLVDFPCLYDNEIVFLCWKYGEPRVAHWHRVADGFAGRRPLLDAAGAEAEASIH